jgi:CBS-domain-containing membrane protein
VREIADVTVGELMSAPVLTVRTDTSIEALTALMTVHEYNAFPVVDAAGALVGIVSRLDLFKLYLVPYRPVIPVLEEVWAATVGAIMSRGVIALDAAEPAIRAMALMVDHGIRTIPIVTDTAAGATVIGVVTRRDLARALKA